MNTGRFTRLHKHIRILILLTVIVRGGMYLGWPIQSGVDDNQGYQRYVINKLLDGDLLIGNVRYNTGYPLAIAPVAAVAQMFGRLDERVVLLFQVALCALIPFLLYDLLRRHHSRLAALLVALLALLDPFGLQWAHLVLPVWLIAFLFVLSVWIMDRSLRRGFRPAAFAVAGLLLGLATLARVNFAPIVALTAILLLFVQALTIRRRLIACSLLGLFSIAAVAAYVLLIHFPSTGTWRLSCNAGTNLMDTLHEANVPVREENGVATSRLLRLIALPAIVTPDWTGRSWPNWQRPGPWVSAEVHNEFLAQTPSEDGPGQYDLWFPGVLVYHLGYCETDSLLLGAVLEALGSSPLRFALSIPGEVLHLLAQNFGWCLPHSNDMEFREDNSLPFPLNRMWSLSGGEYKGAIVWPLPMVAWSHVRDSLNLFKLLVVPALVWSLVCRRPLYVAASVILLAWSIVIALLEYVEVGGRLIAPLWPLWPLLIGGMLADVWQWIRSRRGSHSIHGV